MMGLRNLTLKKRNFTVITVIVASGLTMQNRLDEQPSLPWTVPHCPQSASKQLITAPKPNTCDRSRFCLRTHPTQASSIPSRAPADPLSESPITLCLCLHLPAGNSLLTPPVSRNAASNCSAVSPAPLAHLPRLGLRSVTGLYDGSRSPQFRHRRGARA